MKLTKNFWISLFVALGLFGGVQYYARGVFADPDGFYHAKASQLLSHGQLHNTFPWLYYTTWNKGYADQHFLYHWLLVPFNTVDRLQLSIVVFGLLFVGLFLFALRKYKVKYEAFWTLLLLGGSTDFFFRVNLVKANTISLALLCIIVLLVYIYHFAETNKKRAWALGGIALVSGVFVWTYGGFICVPFLLAAYTTAYIFARIILKKDWKLKSFGIAFAPAIASVIGILVALFGNPNSHHLVSLLYDQLFLTGLGAGTVVPAGNEWKPFDLVWFFQSNILLLIVWGISMTVLAHSIIKERSKMVKGNTLALWLQLTAFGLMALTLWHRRFVEYWTPFAVLASAVTLQPFADQITWQSFKDAVKYWQMKVAIVGLVLASLLAMLYSIRHTADSLKNSESGTRYQAAGVWLEENSKQGDIVFNTQWDQFPQMFYWDSKDYYLVGLDPTFMYIDNKYLYWRWRKIADDKPEDWNSPQEVHDIISKEFKAKFLTFSRDRNPHLYDYLTSDEGSRLFKVGFVSEDVVVFQVLR